MESTNPKTLQEAIQYFSDEQVCVDVVALMRWMDGAKCPDCWTPGGDKGRNPYYLKTQKRWKCRDCRRQFSVKVGTIFEDSPISLQKWLPALWMLLACKNGVSSWELHRALGVSQKTAWFMLHRLRLALKTESFAFKVGGKDSGGVEVDETFVGGKLKNMHRDRRARFASEQGHTGGATGKAGGVVHHSVCGDGEEDVAFHGGEQAGEVGAVSGGLGSVEGGGDSGLCGSVV